MYIVLNIKVENKEMDLARMFSKLNLRSTIRLALRSPRFRYSVMLCVSALFMFYIITRVLYIYDCANKEAFFSQDPYYVQTFMYDKDFIQYFNKREFSDTTKKKVLYWGPKQGLAVSIVQTEKECVKKCDIPCEVSGDYTNEKELDSSDAVVFVVVEMWSKNWHIDGHGTHDFPPFRHPHQPWIAWNLEPTTNFFGDPSVFDNKFNWTMWYRKVATLKQRYGGYRELVEAEQAETKLRLKDTNPYREKPKFITGLISHCDDPARRFVTIAELQKYLEMDMYGACYEGVCGKAFKDDPKLAKDPLGCDHLLSQYRFYLAFENSQCVDYVTEKYWESINRGNIPVVNWKYVHPDIVIPGSYINVFDFEDIKTAAAHILEVNSNEWLYNSYFSWKQKYTRTDPECASCEICRSLQKESNIPAQIITDFDGWLRNDTCIKVNKQNLQELRRYHSSFKSYQRCK